MVCRMSEMFGQFSVGSRRHHMSLPHALFVHLLLRPLQAAVEGGHLLSLEHDMVTSTGSNRHVFRMRRSDVALQNSTTRKLRESRARVVRNIVPALGEVVPALQRKGLIGGASKTNLFRSPRRRLYGAFTSHPYLHAIEARSIRKLRDPRSTHKTRALSCPCDDTLFPFIGAW